MHWDGRQWQQMPLPRAPASDSPGLNVPCSSQDPVHFGMEPVTAIRPGDVWVVGYETAESLSYAGNVCPRAFHWDGKTWHAMWLAAGQQDIRAMRGRC
jgi:hypothetical protein